MILYAIRHKEKAKYIACRGEIFADTVRDIFWFESEKEAATHYPHLLRSKDFEFVKFALLEVKENQ